MSELGSLAILALLTMLTKYVYTVCIHSIHTANCCQCLHCLVLLQHVRVCSNGRNCMLSIAVFASTRLQRCCRCCAIFQDLAIVRLLSGGSTDWHIPAMYVYVHNDAANCAVNRLQRRGQHCLTLLLHQQPTGSGSSKLVTLVLMLLLIQVQWQVTLDVQWRVTL
jgi:hypothetical protein